MTTSCELENDVKYWRLVILMAMTMAATMGAKAAESSADKRFEALSSAEYEWRRAPFAPGEDDADDAPRRLPDVGPAAPAKRLARRPEDRRVGTECGGTCRVSGSPNT